jgi:hypothetical protein
MSRATATGSPATIAPHAKWVSWSISVRYASCNLDSLSTDDMKRRRREAGESLAIPLSNRGLSSGPIGRNSTSAPSVNTALTVFACSLTVAPSVPACNCKHTASVVNRDPRQARQRSKIRASVPVEMKRRSSSGAVERGSRTFRSHRKHCASPLSGGPGRPRSRFWGHWP